MERRRRPRGACWLSAASWEKALLKKRVVSYMECAQ
jgi:hypothetical protein